MKKKRMISLCVIAILLFSLSGCALLAMPFNMASGAASAIGNILGAAVNLVEKLPKPPPWVFL